MFYYKDWYNAGILFLTDLIENGLFKRTEQIFLMLRTKKSKANLIFDYMKLQQAIPKVWIHQITNMNAEYPLNKKMELPCIIVNKKEKQIHELSSKSFYRLIMFCNRIPYTNMHCLFWETNVSIDITWSSVFKRFFLNLQENKLREFCFKFFYNLLPTRRNLHKWGVTNDNKCLHCNVEEDVIHAFFTCKLNEPFFVYLQTVIKDVFHKEIKIDINCLFILEHEDLYIVLVVALWCIYKFILERNSTQYDRRESSLIYVFKREITGKIRLIEKMQKVDNMLPKRLLNYI